MRLLVVLALEMHLPQLFLYPLQIRLGLLPLISRFHDGGRAVFKGGQGEGRGEEEAAVGQEGGLEAEGRGIEGVDVVRKAH